MQLSHNARKGLAIGLAASTMLMTASLGFIPAVFAAAHGQGCLVSSNGTVYVVDNGQRRGITSADVFLSHGWNFGSVTSATSEDLALPTGANVPYADGTLVKGPSDPLVYVVTAGQKRPFVSGTVFTGRGYSFANIRTAAVNTFADLPTGANVENTTDAHSVGIWVIASGTVWRIVAGGRQGVPDMATWNSYGRPWDIIVAANAADLALPNLGLLPMRVNCAGSVVTSGPISASLASDTPASGTIVQSQSTALLAKFAFTGSGQVNQLQLQRVGISTDASVTGVYLYDGGTRLTDASSVVSGSLVNFNSSAGLFTVSGSRTISVRADISGSAAAGSTVGIRLNSYTPSGNSAMATSLSGNLMTVSGVATASVAVGADTVSSQNVNAPATNLSLWGSALTGNTRIVKLDSVNFKFIGSAPYDSLQNLKLYFNGNQIGTASGVNTLGYIVVDLTGSPYSIPSGGGTLELRGDVVKGSNRTFSISVANPDLMIEDSNFAGVNITPSGLPTGSATTFSVQAGTVTSSTDSTFNTSATVTGGTSNVPLARYKLQAYGEDVKITSLAVLPIIAGSPSPAAAGLSNVTLYANGSQVGTVQNWAQAAAALTFNFGSQLTVPAAGQVLLEIHADTMTSAGVNYTAGTLQFTLTGAAQNAQGVSSSNVFQVNPNLTSPAITIGSGGLTLSANTALLSQTTVPNQSNTKIGSFVMQAGASESVRVSNLKVDLTFGGAATTYVSGTLNSVSSQSITFNSTTNIAVGDILTIEAGATDTVGTVTSITSPTVAVLNITVAGSTTGTPAAVNSGTSGPYTTNDLTNVHTSENPTPVTTASSMNFPVSFTLAPNTTKTIDVFADLGSKAAGTAQTSLTATTTGVTSNTTVQQNGNGTAVTGQVFTVANGSLATPTKVGAPASPVTQFAVGGLVGVNGNNNPVMTLNFVASNGTAQIQEMKFAITGANTVNSITVNGVNAPVVSGTADLVFSTPISVPVGFAGTNVAVIPTYNSVGLGGITSNTASTVTLNFVKSQVGNASPVTTTPSVASAAMNLVASKPAPAVGTTTTSTSTTRSGLTNALVKLIDVTITASASGPVKLEQLPIVTTSSGVATVATGSNNLVVKDETNTTLTTTNTTYVVAANGTSGSVPIIFTTPINIPAGTSKTFSVYATAATVSGASNTTSLTTTLGTSSTFLWTDVNGNVASITGALIYNYPLETSTISN